MSIFLLREYTASKHWENWTLRGCNTCWWRPKLNLNHVLPPPVALLIPVWWPIQSHSFYSLQYSIIFACGGAVSEFLRLHFHHRTQHNHWGSGVFPQDFHQGSQRWAPGSNVCSPSISHTKFPGATPVMVGSVCFKLRSFLQCYIILASVVTDDCTTYHCQMIRATALLALLTLHMAATPKLSWNPDW